MAVRVQQEDFDVAAELAALAPGDRSVGGVVSFVGLVRDLAGDAPITAMTLEHYPGMTERKLTDIERAAHRRWPLSASLIVHRYGRLAPGDQIVLVAVASAHRAAAFDACRFVIDYLKTEAPFWKLEHMAEADRWVDAQTDDATATARWREETGAR